MQIESGHIVRPMALVVTLARTASLKKKDIKIMLRIMIGRED